MIQYLTRIKTMFEDARYHHDEYNDLSYVYLDDYLNIQQAQECYHLYDGARQIKHFKTMEHVMFYLELINVASYAN